jgi:RNA polymerase sigma-70 factor, ECF subfamily
VSSPPHRVFALRAVPIFGKAGIGKADTAKDGKGSVMEMLSDNEIIYRVQHGERELFGELHTRHHERVYRYVAHSIFQRETAQDVAGEVWLRAYSAVDRFQPRSENSVIAWLLRIATNLVTDYRRRLEPVCQLDEEDDKGTLRLVSPAAEAEMLRAEGVRAVRGALAQLSPGDRQIIYLAHQDDLSCAEIAVALHKSSISAVTSHLHRAMCHLREKLMQSDWFAETEDSAIRNRQVSA